jgi:hypothetical protein
MTFEKALEKLGKIAGGKYHVLRYEVGIHYDGERRTEISAYVDGYSWEMDHPTFQKALDSVRELIKPKKKKKIKFDNAKIDDGADDGK